MLENVLKHPLMCSSSTHLPISTFRRYSENSSIEYLYNRIVFRWVPRQGVVGKNTTAFSQGIDKFVEKRLKVPFSYKNLYIETLLMVSCLAEAIHNESCAMYRKVAKTAAIRKSARFHTF